jgi:hypothetical protein
MLFQNLFSSNRNHGKYVSAGDGKQTKKETRNKKRNQDIFLKRGLENYSSFDREEEIACVTKLSQILSLRSEYLLLTHYL